jgi:hypothetical protein
MCGGSGENVCVFGRMCCKVLYFDVQDRNT